MKSILRWAGSKSRVCQQVLKEFPKFDGSYYEPFVGSGTVFVNTDFKNQSIISDTNTELINFLSQIKSDYTDVINEFSNFKNNEEEYYKIRALDREVGFDKRNKSFRAARFYYLNKTCFQGLWRVNSSGYNNVPYGKLKSISHDIDLVKRFSDKLQLAIILEADFEKALSMAKENDFVYLDPPYIKVSETSNFTSYTKEGFKMKEHLQLKERMDILNARGVKVLLSNSDCDQTKELYKEYSLKEIVTNRSISAINQGRKNIKELLIKNY